MSLWKLRKNNLTRSFVCVTAKCLAMTWTIKHFHKALQTIGFDNEYIFKRVLSSFVIRTEFPFINNWFPEHQVFFADQLNFLFCSRTPGSRQPSPADETITRPQSLLDPSTNLFHQQQFQHILSSNMDLSFHPPMMNHQMQGAVMNGVGGLQIPQVEFDIRNNHTLR